MSVFLRRSDCIPEPGAYGSWLAVTGTAAALDAKRKLPGLAQRLEQAFVSERETWWRLGRALSCERSADIAHMPTAGSFGSDFGVMLAWTRLAGELAQDSDVTLVLCDDPWLFRHLALIQGVDAGPSPALAPEVIRLTIRGVLARTGAALRCAWAALRLGGGRLVMKPGDVVILVYGHPDSDAQGNDAYFGDIMARFPAVRRLLHTDCRAGRARELGTDGRTASLHAWGHLLFALGLIFSRWRLDKHHLLGEHGWLIRRARTMENGGGGPAMNRWQKHCQNRWLTAAKPDRVLWPWENHGWERNLCRAARRHGVKLIGYQHTVIGRHQFNFATATNPDGLGSIPDVVVADGRAYRDEMQAWGVPGDRLIVGGAFRFQRFPNGLFDPSGPVFVPLSAVPTVALTQIEAARTIARSGRRVVVKSHPMYPVAFNGEANLELGKTPLAAQKGLSAVLYATGVSGLEARLMGIPAYRLMPDDRIAIDVLPAGIEAETVTSETAADAILADGAPAIRVPWDDVLSDPDFELWKSLLFDDIEALVRSSKGAERVS